MRQNGRTTGTPISNSEWVREKIRERGWTAAIEEEARLVHQARLELEALDDA